MSDVSQNEPAGVPAYHVPGHGLRRIEHYTLYLLNGIAAGGSGCPTDEDIDLAIDLAERLAHKLTQRGHIK